MCGKLPSEATFSRAFDEFAKTALPGLAHEALIKEHLGDALIGHISRDGTAIEARERPARADKTDAAATEAGRRRWLLLTSQARRPALEDSWGEKATAILASKPSGREFRKYAWPR